MNSDIINIEITKHNRVPAKTVYGVGACYDYVGFAVSKGKKYHQYKIVEKICQ